MLIGEAGDAQTAFFRALGQARPFDMRGDVACPDLLQERRQNAMFGITLQGPGPAVGRIILRPGQTRNPPPALRRGATCPRVSRSNRAPPNSFPSRIAPAAEAKFSPSRSQQPRIGDRAIDKSEAAGSALDQSLVPAPRLHRRPRLADAPASRRAVRWKNGHRKMAPSRRGTPPIPSSPANWRSTFSWRCRKIGNGSTIR